MSRNTPNRFFNAPQVKVGRSSFKIPFNHTTTFDPGRLIPFYHQEVLPGDTHSIQTKAFIRMTTPITPTMDNSYADIYYFFVPYRLCWSLWEQMGGEDDPDAWNPSIEEVILPVLDPPLNDTELSGLYSWKQHTLFDYIVGGIWDNNGVVPVDRDAVWSNMLPFQAYCKIWNDWFRDENFQYKVDFQYNAGSGARFTGSNGETSLAFAGDESTPSNAVLGGMPLPVNKFKDYFTTALPLPQKGSPVQIPLGEISSVDIPVVPVPGKYNSFVSVGDNGYLGWTDSNTNVELAAWSGSMLGQKNALYAYTNSSTGKATLTSINSTDPVNGNPGWNFANLWARTSAADLGFITVNQLREAFQIQRLLEIDARGGTRYIEQIKAHFGVTSPDARMQRSEYLGGERVPITITQVLQTSASSASGTDTPLGDTGAYSVTVTSKRSFTKSFTEHGVILGLICVRNDNTYCQGISKEFKRRRKFDFYYPALANLGEQPIYKSEIYAYNVGEEEVFGYQEAWAEYRYKPNRVSGRMRPFGDNLGQIWTYADYYYAPPSLSSDWLTTDPNNIRRTVAVPSEPVYLADFSVLDIATRPMPLYSIPGLIDHVGW